MNAELKTTNAESVVSVIAVLLLLILSLLGPEEMFVGSIVGLAVCVFLIRDGLRGRGWLTAAVFIAVVTALAWAVAIVVSLA